MRMRNTTIGPRTKVLGVGKIQRANELVQASVGWFIELVDLAKVPGHTIFVRCYGVPASLANDSRLRRVEV
jgi:hypothetical protein